MEVVQCTVTPAAPMPTAAESRACSPPRSSPRSSRLSASDSRSRQSRSAASAHAAAAGARSAGCAASAPADRLRARRHQDRALGAGAPHGRAAYGGRWSSGRRRVRGVLGPAGVEEGDGEHGELAAGQGEQRPPAPFQRGVEGGRFVAALVGEVPRQRLLVVQAAAVGGLSAAWPTGPRARRGRAWSSTPCRRRRRRDTGSSSPAPCRGGGRPVPGRCPMVVRRPVPGRPRPPTCHWCRP
jgi:hypothetical protein